jgi:hypothetical protein
LGVRIDEQAGRDVRQAILQRFRPAERNQTLKGMAGVLSKTVNIPLQYGEIAGANFDFKIAPTSLTRSLRL